jgi:tetratricopeptide (TPR) repeat protein
LEIETTALDGAAADSDGSLLDGLELTSSDFGQTRRSAPQVPSIRDEVTADDTTALAGLEPTVSDEAETAGEDLELEEAPAAPPPQPPRATPPPKRKTVVEIPPLELEPDFDVPEPTKGGEFETAATASGHEVDDEPLVIEEGTVGGSSWLTVDDSSSVGETAKLDLGVDGILNQGDQAGALMFDDIVEEAPAAPSIEDLEGQVADNPDDPHLHQALGEALIEAGERERGLEELDIAVGGYETAGDVAQAEAMLDEILRLDPNSVRHRQKGVEFAYKAGDKSRLIEAYLELADALLRSDLGDKARSVYERVVEHDPKNARARAALAMLAPAPPAAPAAKGEGKVAAKDAKMKVRDEAGADGDFVDLGAMILEEEVPERDTRMKVEDEEPTGDEEQDFHEMLARFRQGIDENIDEGDFQSHYDLGVAFKEMGLLDEAIAEFQKALRAPEGKLRTSESLGVCFFEKGAHGVAESILRRALDIPATGDEERQGILYWLGRALQEQGRSSEAKDLYGRVFAVNIRFMDVGERVKALAKAR